MIRNRHFDVIIMGGSYSGLAAGMALGRALRKVLIMDSGVPCNRQTPRSHNLITQDGKTPWEIARLARQDVEKYDTIKFFSGQAIKGTKTVNGFEIQTSHGETYGGKKLIFATGIRDVMPVIEGFAECWGISVLHCPYCHGYEVKNVKNGILGNGDYAFEFASLISNWTNDLTLYTNGMSTLTVEQKVKIEKHQIETEEREIEKLEHSKGKLHALIFKDGTRTPLEAVYARCSFEQNSMIPETLGCEMTEQGYIRTDSFQRTTIPGVYACGDNTSRMRTLAHAIATGTNAGMTVNKDMIEEEF
jgi:thioredoxin reductase